MSRQLLIPGGAARVAGLVIRSQQGRCLLRGVWIPTDECLGCEKVLQVPKETFDNHWQRKAACADSIDPPSHKRSGSKDC
jgi:hypothetical protein